MLLKTGNGKHQNGRLLLLLGKSQRMNAVGSDETNTWCSQAQALSILDPGPVPPGCLNLSTTNKAIHLLSMLQAGNWHLSCCVSMLVKFT